MMAEPIHEAVEEPKGTQYVVRTNEPTLDGPLDYMIEKIGDTQPARCQVVRAVLGHVRLQCHGGVRSVGSEGTSGSVKAPQDWLGQKRIVVSPVSARTRQSWELAGGLKILHV